MLGKGRHRLFWMLLLVYLLTGSTTYAYTSSDSLDLVTKHFSKYLPKTPSPKDSVSSFDQFQALWSGAYLNDAQRSQVEKIIEKFREKKMTGRQSAESLALMLYHARFTANLSDFDFDDLLQITLHVTEDLEKSQSLRFMSSMHHFFAHEAIYYSNYYSLLTKGIFRLEYKREEVPDIPLGFDDVASAKDEDEWGDWGSTDSSNDDPWGSWDNSGWGDSGDSWDTGGSQTAEPEIVEVDEKELAYSLFAQEIPYISGPTVIWDQVDLRMQTGFDTFDILATSGTWMPIQGQFVGKSGQVNWEKLGLTKDSVQVTLSEYALQVSKPAIRAEKSKMSFLGKFAGAIEGSFEYKSIRLKGNQKPTYPRFSSYTNDIERTDLPEGVYFRGGFSLWGKDISSAAMVPGISYLSVSKEGNRKFNNRGRVFVFQDSIITSKATSATIFTKRDSIFHPEVRLNYDFGSEHLRLYKSENGFKNTPFYASYYKMDVYTDHISWAIASDSIDLTIFNARKEIPAIFESKDFFNADKLVELSTPFSFDVLSMAANYSKRTGKRSFYVSDLADAYKLKYKQVKSAVQAYHQAGMMNLDTKNDKISLSEKGQHYLDSKQKRKDFDNLSIPSLSPGDPNATLRISDMDLTIRGINRFNISEELEVYIVPDSNQIRLQNNRNFEFNGNLFAGNYEIIGKDFKFDYHNFLIELTQIDSIRFYIEEEIDGRKVKKQVENKLMGENEEGSFGSDDDQVSGQVANTIQGTSGTLYINMPDNKSASKQYPQYPIFNANKGATVYFDNEKVLSGAYDRSMYFSIPPFEIDSTSSSDPGSIAFQGVFHSSGMFPDFEEKIRVMPDNSLGFTHAVPPGGYEIYNGKGHLESDLRLDGKGLRGSGKIDFLTATVSSSELTFYPDSVVGRGEDGIVRQGELNGTSYPDMRMPQYRLRWAALKDSMYLRSIGEPFQLYQGSAQLKGTSILTPGGLYAAGQLETRGTKVLSRAMLFKENSYLARYADLEVPSSEANKPTIVGDNVRLNFDLNRNIAQISPEVEGEAAISFPFAQINTSISNAVWDLDAKVVRMSKPADVPIEKSYFYSTLKDLDSLAFSGSDAVYDLVSQEMTVSGIPFIKVADAKVIPAGNQIKILENSEIRELYGATIVLDTIYEFHKITEARVRIFNRNKFEGEGTYQFMNAMGDVYPIQLRDFGQETPIDARGREGKPYSTAFGSVAEKDRLIISPGMFFKGKLKLKANTKALELDGFVKLNLQNIPGYDTWIGYKNTEDIAEIIFDYNTALTEKAEPLVAGIHYETGSMDLYSTFISDKRTSADEDFFSPSGLLSYDPEENAYRIEDPAKKKGESYAGKIFTYNENTAAITFEGPLKFQGEKSPYELKASGIGQGNLASQEFLVNSLITLQFTTPSQVFDIMAKDLADVVERTSAPEGMGDRTEFFYKVAEIIGDRALNEYDKRSASGYFPIFQLSPQLMKNLVISNLDLNWSPTNRAWYNQGKIGISNILKTDINATLDGFFEYRKTAIGDALNIFIQAAPDAWYFISFEDNRLLLFSSNELFNKTVAGKSNVAKAKIGEYVFVKGNEDETLEFINRFRKNYLGIDTPFQLGKQVESKEKKDDDEEPAGFFFEDDDDGF